MIQKGLKTQNPHNQKDYKGFCEGRRIRTFDRLLRRQVLYPSKPLKTLHLFIFIRWCANYRQTKTFLKLFIVKTYFKCITIFPKQKKEKKKAVQIEVMMNENGRKHD